MTLLRWHRLDPAVPCLSPDGHDLVDVVTAGSAVPVACLCTRCGERATIIVLPEE